MNPRFHASRTVAGALFLLLGLTAPGCRESSDGGQPEAREPGFEAPARGPAASAYDVEGLRAMRAAKDEAFREEESPIPAPARASFPGLAYFEPDPAFAFRVPLERFDDPEEVKVAATGGDVRMMTRVGRFRFSVDGKACSLAVYKSDPSTSHLFVPFTDRTNGEETYEVGRYLDLEEHPGDAPYLLDFNLSYNPYCAYNESYTCPIVPKENALHVDIRAGEKLPPFAGHKE